MSILDTIVKATQERVKKEKEKGISYDFHSKLPRFSFEQALKATSISFICEVKKASPSKGIIAEDFPYLEIAKDYETAGAAAISVLTEPEYFLGANHYLSEIRKAVNIPLLRKDFVVDSFQVEQAHALGADAVLLIAAVLTDNQLSEYFKAANDLGLSVLFEVHDEEEMKRALHAGARMIGVNNRNLHDFSVDIQNSIRLRSMAPTDIVFVSESGIGTHADIYLLQNSSIDAVLIGETLMRKKDKLAALAELRGKGQ